MQREQKQIEVDKKDNRPFRIITIALLAGILCLLILLYNRNVATHTPPTTNPQTRQQTEQDQIPNDEKIPEVQSI